MEGLKGFTTAQRLSMFCQAAVQQGLLEAEDQSYALNLLLDLYRLDAPEAAASMLSLLKLSDMLVDQAVSQGLAEDSPEARERFSARLFGFITPSPRAVRERFWALYQEGPERATDWFYRLCRDNDYIRTRQIAQNLLFTADSPAGKLEITINLSKPEKDPRDIAAARRLPSAGYPRCMLCYENPGYAGRPGYPARQNHRMIPVTLGQEPWYLQYSPYLYYEEHCIALNREHLPMQMGENSFDKMFDFVGLFPHYFIGSNADLPIVGGSILTHDHFQGGRYVFPMERAGTWFDIDSGDSAVTMSALTWPMSCLKLASRSRDRLSALMLRILDGWRAYSDERLGIIHRTNEAHNAITPVLRLHEGVYTCYMLLRNNRTSGEHPLGIYHPHARWHHIKRENIGLIEAMGLFILPGRLKEELAQVEAALKGEAPLPPDSPHTAWLAALQAALPAGTPPDKLGEYIHAELGLICYALLCDTGVYKQDDQGKAGFLRFLNSLGMGEKD